jgi:hypothetical protein
MGDAANATVKFVDLRRSFGVYCRSSAFVPTSFPNLEAVKGLRLIGLAWAPGSLPHLTSLEVLGVLPETIDAADAAELRAAAPGLARLSACAEHAEGMGLGGFAELRAFVLKVIFLLSSYRQVPITPRHHPRRHLSRR